MKSTLRSITLAVAAVTLTATPSTLAQQALKIAPVHRYNFANPSGPVTNGTQVTDLVGTAHATVRGTGANADGSAIRLPGGSSASAPYIDLPNGLASGSGQIFPGYANATYELWVTVHSAQNWSRLFDFGKNTAGETTAPGGTFNGTDYLFVSANIGTALDARLERGGANLTGGGAQDAAGATVLGSQAHIVVTYDSAVQSWKMYRNGTLLRALPTMLGPSSINDVNVWLGRSNWSADANADATYNELRIYDYALSDQQVLGNYQSGPDTVNVVAPDPIAPVFSPSTFSRPDAPPGVPYSNSIAGTATDATPGDTLTYSKASGPSWLNVAPSGALTGTPPGAATGLNQFTVRATDASGNYSNATLEIMVTGSFPAGWSSNDIGTVGIAGASSGDGNGFTVSGSGNDIWDAADAFQFTSTTLTGNGEIRARLMSQSNTDPWAKAGVMIRDGSTPGAINALAALTPSNGFTFQWRNAANGGSAFTLGPAANAAPNNWVRLTRSGTLITAYISANGTAWNQVGTTTLTMSANVSIGLAVTSHNNSALSTAVFDNVTVTAFPPPWIAADLGTTGLGGSAEFFGNAYTIKGAGLYGGTTDGFRYVYQSLSGDGSIVARVNTVHNTGTSARIGIMIRDTLNNNSRMAALSVTGSSAYKWERRTTTGGNVTNTNSSSGTAPNIWIRLTRSGNTITAAKSTNGTTWTTISSATVTMASNCYIGLSVASGSTTTLNTSVIDNVTVVP